VNQWDETIRTRTQNVKIHLQKESHSDRETTGYRKRSNPVDFKGVKMQERQMAEQNLILKVLVGSHLYGTNTESSDRDYVGIFIPSKDYILGLKTCEQVEIRTNPTDSGKRNSKEDTDTVIYSLPKFIKLAYENNPNITETFFVDPPHILFCNEFGKQLLDNYKLFISTRVKHKFLGYAHSQKMKLLNKEPIGNRKEYLEKFGYDVKFASHLIRLLTEGLELLVEGRLAFPITHNRLVRDIKEGKLDLSQVLTKADHLESLVEESYVKSTLPHTPDLDAINNLQIQMLENFWKSM
jgi:predicted nucleotidyltransferase